MRTLFAAMLLMVAASVFVTGCKDAEQKKPLQDADTTKPKQDGDPTKPKQDDPNATKPNSPTIPPQEKEAVEIALKCVMKLDSLTKTGIKPSEYSSRLLDIKVDFDFAIVKIPTSNPIRLPLDKAMRAFVLARNYLDYCDDPKNPSFSRKGIGFRDGFRTFKKGISEDEMKGWSKEGSIEKEFTAWFGKKGLDKTHQYRERFVRSMKELSVLTGIKEEVDPTRAVAAILWILEETSDVNLIWEYASFEISNAQAIYAKW